MALSFHFQYYFHKYFLILNQYFDGNKFFFGNENNNIIILDKFTNTDCIIDCGHINIILNNTNDSEKNENKDKINEDNYFMKFYSAFLYEYDIVKYIKDKYKLLVGDRTAEDIKITIGTVFPGSRNEKMEVRGRDLVTGLPHSVTITSDEVEEALRESIYTIVHAAKGILEQTPPELSADIIDKGIVLTGGGCMVDGFSQLLSQELKVPVFIAESPLTCVAEGTGVLLDNIHMINNKI